MFGLSWTQIGIIVLVGVFVLGPERIPTAVRFVSDALVKTRTFVAGAQSSLDHQIGPELDELRRQVAELQGLKELLDIEQLRDLHPQRLIASAITNGQPTTGRVEDRYAPRSGPPEPSGPPLPVELTEPTRRPAATPPHQT